MPLRFVTHLTVTRTPAGVRLSYGNPGDADGILIVSGPGPVIPPDREFTAAEYDQWQFDLTCNTGYAIGPGPARGTVGYRVGEWCPVVEVLRTIEDEIPAGAVAANLVWLRVAETHAPTLGVEVVNRWTRPVPHFSLATAFDAGHTLPVPDAPPEFDLREGMAGSESAFHRVGVPIGGAELVPTLPALFALDVAFFPGVRSRADALSPDQHWIELRTHGCEFDRIPGAAVADFLATDPPPAADMR